jgi:hypothetical protein
LCYDSLISALPWLLLLQQAMKFVEQILYAASQEDGEHVLAEAMAALSGEPVDVQEAEEHAAEALAADVQQQDLLA